MRRRGPKTVPAVRAGVLATALCACVLVFAGTARAAEPWLAQMPTVKQVVAKTQGKSAFDTAARRYVAFDKLTLLTQKLLADRMLEGTGLTPGERAIMDRYNTNRDRITEQQQASLTTARFLEWRKLVDRYWADRRFNDRLLTLFSPRFRAAYPMAVQETFTPRRAAPRPAAPDESTATDAATGDTSSDGISRSVAFLGAFLAGLAFRLLPQRGRLKLDPRDPFRLYLGRGKYVLNHSTGAVSGASKMGTTDVYGRSGYGANAPVTISSSTTIHDQFFLHEPNGQVRSIQLSGWNFPVMEGQVVSAVWAIRDGASAGSYVMLVNHTTGDGKLGRSFLAKHLSRGHRIRQLLTLPFLLVVGFLAPQVTAGSPEAAGWLAFAGAVLGVLVGSGIWNGALTRRFVARFQRDGIPRIEDELHQLAADAAPVPA